MKKIIAIALLLCTMLSLCACPGTTGPGTTGCEHVFNEDGVCTKCGYEKYETLDDIPDGKYNFGGDSLNISCRSDYVYELYAAEGSVEGTDPLIYERNRLVQDRFNLKVQPVITTVAATDQQTHLDEVSDALQTGRFKFDVVSMWIYQSGKLILGGNYLDWRMHTDDGVYVIPYAGESLDKGKEYWPSLMNDPATVFGCQYIAVSDMCLTSYENAYSIVYNWDEVDNLKLAQKAGYTDMYDIVRKGDWTLDMFKTFGSDYYVDNQSAGQKQVKDDADTYGILYAPATGVDAFIHAFGYNVIKNNGQEMPELWNVNLTMTTTIEDLRECLWGPGVYAVNSTSNPLEKMFAEGHGLFATMTLEALRTPTMHAMEDDFGVLPYPKYNKAQKEYYTGSNDHYNTLAVPLMINPNRLELVGVGIEALSAETSRSVEKKFYEKLLKAGSTRLLQDEEMLDKIISGRMYDLVAGHHGDLIIDMDQAAARHLHAMWRILVSDKTLEVGDYWALGSTRLNGDESVEGSLANLINRYITMFDE